MSLILVHIILFLVPKIDVTLFQPGPFLVDETSDEDTQFRGYLAEEYKACLFNIGRRSDTGPGEVVEKIENPPDNFVIDNPAFPAGSLISYADSSTLTHKRMDVTLEGSQEGKERTGAFYIEAEKANGETEKITIIKTASQAAIKFVNPSKASSIGDDISIEVTTSLADVVLRWNHNDEYISAWDGMKSVTITNVRKADEGIYECYEDGRREDGVHAIMNLIVRSKFCFGL